MGSRDDRTQSARACLFFFFTWMVLRLPYILYYFQEFKQQSNSIVLGNYFIPPIYTQTIVKGGRTMGFLPSSWTPKP